MERDFSIESIKKSIIDKLANDKKVIDYLLYEMDEEDRKYYIPRIRKEFIYNYDSGNSFGNINYIAVEVAEHEVTNTIKYRAKKYTVAIRLGLYNKENLDKFASLVKDIISELYPGRYGLSDIPYYVKDYGYMYENAKHNIEKNELNRLITFEIEE